MGRVACSTCVMFSACPRHQQQCQPTRHVLLLRVYLCLQEARPSQRPHQQSPFRSQCRCPYYLDAFGVGLTDCQRAFVMSWGGVSTFSVAHHDDYCTIGQRVFSVSFGLIRCTSFSVGLTNCQQASNLSRSGVFTLFSVIHNDDYGAIGQCMFCGSLGLIRCTSFSVGLTNCQQAFNLSRSGVFTLFSVIHNDDYGAIGQCMFCGSLGLIRCTSFMN